MGRPGGTLRQLNRTIDEDHADYIGRTSRYLPSRAFGTSRNARQHDLSINCPLADILTAESPAPVISLACAQHIHKDRRSFRLPEPLPCECRRAAGKGRSWSAAGPSALASVCSSRDSRPRPTGASQGGTGDFIKCISPDLPQGRTS